ncbi:hypothetical protein [Massilia sp. ST3]|uniref:hypothetical protein n=1 Tax=Massilia sp. ST3 TaxID=2824903 RepID=UPI001B83F7AF|nr:hypothetical protein [Massilia sp. ST3]MBQ5945896.1 hypothetical protein [Massilia sp. ST3]
MQGYSINGYLNAVRRRSSKTILVEGSSDYAALTRLKRSSGAKLGVEPPGQIDVASIITDERVKGYGKRQILQEVLGEVVAKDPTGVNFSSKFGTLQDREWDGLNADIKLMSPWVPPIQNPPHFVTIGHSIENYLFSVEAIEAFLRFNFSNELNQDFFNLLHLRYRAIIHFAAIYSLGVRKIFAISKAQSLITRSCAEWSGASYVLSSSIEPLFKQRHIAFPVEFVAEVNLAIEDFSQEHPNLEPAIWICHGHIGEDAIWACLGNLAREYSGSDQLGQNVERGAKDFRFKHAVDHLATEEGIPREPLTSAIEWLCSP